MTRAEVEAEKVRLRSKLRDKPWQNVDWRFTAVLIAFLGAGTILSYYKVAPDRLLAWLMIGGLLGTYWYLYRRPKDNKHFSRWLGDAENAGYMLCPDCGHDLRGSAEAQSEVVCPECGRCVEIGDLKEIWSGKP